MIRTRRLRRTPALRALVRETRLDPGMLIAPLFVRLGRGLREPIASMPGVARLSPDELGRHCRVDAAGRALLEKAAGRMELSLRTVHRTLAVARSIAARIDTFINA